MSVIIFLVTLYCAGLVFQALFALFLFAAAQAIRRDDRAKAATKEPK